MLLTITKKRALRRSFFCAVPVFSAEKTGEQIKIGLDAQKNKRAAALRNRAANQYLSHHKKTGSRIFLLPVFWLYAPAVRAPTWFVCFVSHCAESL